MKVVNHKPGVLNPTLLSNTASGAIQLTDVITKFIDDACFQPLVAGTSVQLSANGTDITATDVASLLVSEMTNPTIDTVTEAKLDAILTSTLLHYTPSTTSSLTANDMFVNENATELGMDFPDQMTVYTPATDIIPLAKEILAGTKSSKEWFCSLAFAFRPDTLGVAFADEAAFERFKVWLDTQITPIITALPVDTVRLFSDFQNLKLEGLTESISIRKDMHDNNHDMSFARMLQRYLLEYTTVEQEPLYMLLPFSFDKLILPETIVFANVTQHAHATPRQVRNEWDIINQSLSSPVRLISTKKIQKLTAASRSAAKMAAAAATAYMAQPDVKSAHVPFSKTAPTTVNLARIVSRVLTKMASVARSQNSYKDVHRSYMRASRRNPDDYNIAGKSTTTKYKPDIHLYIDTSGSISERNYQDMVKACIQMARKLDVDIYFNSFSHMLSECVLLPMKGRSAKQVYTQFQKVPKVSGGTDYEQIWNYINQSRKRRRELSLIITDFEYNAPRKFVKHPKNLYYVPCSHVDWSNLIYYAEQFCKSAKHIDPAIRSHLLF